MPPPVGAPRAPVIAAPEVRTLGNGLRVVVAQRRGVPLVTAELVVRSGAEADPAALSGLADLTATLLAKGTPTRTAPQIAQAAEALGGQLETGAGWDRAFVTITVTRPQLAAALALVADVTMRPRFAPAELERARRQAIDGLNVALSQPGTLARVAANRAAFGAGTYGHSASGTPASLARMKRADVAALHAARYRPDNATLVLAGDIDVEDALRLAQAAFGGWKRPRDARAPVTVTAPDPALRGPVAIAMAGAGQAGVALAAPSIARTAPDYYAGVVANTLLGNGYSSRLNQEVRIRRGLSYGVVSRLDARRAGGVFSVAVQTKNASAPEVVAVTLAEIARVAADAGAGRRARSAQARGDRRCEPEFRDDGVARRHGRFAGSRRRGRRRTYAHDPAARRRHRGRGAGVRARALGRGRVPHRRGRRGGAVRRCAARSVSGTRRRAAGRRRPRAAGARQGGREVARAGAPPRVAGLLR